MEDQNTDTKPQFNSKNKLKLFDHVDVNLKIRKSKNPKDKPRLENPKITEITNIFKTNSDMDALLTSLQNFLNEEHADIADCGPRGAMAHYFIHNDHNQLQNIVEKIEQMELEAIGDKVKEYMKYYPIINESKPRDKVDRHALSKITAGSGSQLMHHMLLNNGANVNFACFDNNNPNEIAVSPLGFCLTNWFDSLKGTDVIKNLVARNAKLTQAEMPVLAQLFVKTSAKNAEEMDMHVHFDVLQNIALNSNVSLQNIRDLDCNNPIHIAVMNQNGDANNNPIEDRQQSRILSQLCHKYPFWVKQRNFDGDYPLFLSIKFRDIASTFAILSFLSENDYDEMRHMMQHKAFVEHMIAWVLGDHDEIYDDSSSEVNVEIAKLFVELFDYEAIFSWPNPLDLNSRKAPITIIDCIERKGTYEGQLLMDILIKKCNIQTPMQNKHLMAGHKINAEQEILNPNEEDDLVDHGGGFGFDMADIRFSDEDELVDENEEKDNKVPSHVFVDLFGKEEDDMKHDIEKDVKKQLEGDVQKDMEKDEKKELEKDDIENDIEDDTKAVNWPELFYSMLVESFSTADLYTDIVIMVGLYTARQQWWVTFMIAFVVAP
eukprot:887559_1